MLLLRQLYKVASWAVAHQTKTTVSMLAKMPTNKHKIK